MQWWNESKMVKWWYFDIVIWCDSLLLGQTCKTTLFISFSKHLENIRGYDILDSLAMKTKLESLTEEVIQLYEANKEQHKTLNRVENFLEQLWYVNGKQKSYNASTNTYKISKTDVDIKSEDKDTDYINVKNDVSSSKPFEDFWESKAVKKIFF